MGYSTDFTGRLEFINDLTIKQLVALEAMCGEDCREHREWDADEATYLDLKVTADKEGLEWDGSEKTYSMVAIVNLVLREMRKTWPDFGLRGQLLAQGDEASDRWILKIGEDGWAVSEPIVLASEKITCPQCHYTFLYETPAIKETL